MSETWTIRRVLEWAAQDFRARGLDSPRLDAELLVASALGVGRVALYMDLDRPLSEKERAAIRELVKRRRNREPVAYILGKKEFYGRTFLLSRAVLIPRPDTETLIERALALLPHDTEGPVLDLCTGSGAIGLTLAAERPSLRVDLTDISQEALAVARENAEQLGVIHRARFFAGDLFAPVPTDARYALVGCNPPYLAERDVEALAPEIRDHEPRHALVAGPEGFEMHRRLVEGVPRVLAPNGTLLIEVGAGQAEPLERMLAEHKWVQATARHRDLAGIDRVVEARAK